MSCWQENKNDKGQYKVTYVALCALIDKDGRVLLNSRLVKDDTGNDIIKWEFPGGKLHPSESPEQAIIRELREELSIDTLNSCLSPLCFNTLVPAEGKSIVLLLYVCRNWKGQMSQNLGQELKWVYPNEIGQLELLPASYHLAAIIRDLL